MSSRCAPPPRTCIRAMHSWRTCRRCSRAAGVTRASASGCRRARASRCCARRVRTRCCSGASTRSPKTCRRCSARSRRIASWPTPMPATARHWRARSCTPFPSTDHGRTPARAARTDRALRAPARAGSLADRTAPRPHLRAAHEIRPVLRHDARRDGAGRAELQQQSGAAADVAARRRGADEPAQRAPAIERAAVRRFRRGPGARGRADPAAPACTVEDARARPARVARGLRRRGDGVVAGRRRRRRGAGAADPSPRLARRAAPARVDDATAGPRARVVMDLAGATAAGVSRARTRGPAAARRRRRRRTRAPASARRRRAPPARVPSRRSAAHHRLETDRAPGQPAGARIRTSALGRHRARLDQARRPRIRSAHRAARTLGRRSRARCAALSPDRAGPSADRPRPWSRAPACVPARIGVVAVKVASERLDARTRAAVLLAAGACVVPLLLQLQRTLAFGIAVAAVAIALGTWRRPAAAWVRVSLALVLAIAVFATMGVNFGRDTGCAMLAAMLAVKPAETNTMRDARSLVGFALFAPFATFLLDQGPLSLGLGLVAVYFAL